jgi:uncharacterized membrane protein YphA (DoxX/SURF4 family)
MARRVTIEVISLLFILLFVYASVSKLLDYEKFSIQIGQSPLLTGFGGSIPWLVIAVELIVSVMLAVPRMRLIAFFGAFSLMVMFTAYIYAVLHFSPFVPCSCGGVLEKLGWSEHLVFNGVFVGLAFIGVLLHGTRSNEGNQPQAV